MAGGDPAMRWRLTRRSWRSSSTRQAGLAVGGRLLVAAALLVATGPVGAGSPLEVRVVRAVKAADRLPAAGAVPDGGQAAPALPLGPGAALLVPMTG